MPVFRFPPSVRALRHISLFDRGFYLRKYPDLAATRVNPLLHYLRYGAPEGRKPHALFDPEFYLSRHPELRGNGNPLLHFLEHGGPEQGGGNPHPLFDCEAYLQAHPEAAAQGLNPLVHHLLQLRGSRSTASGTEGGLFGCAS
jgi:hypothetical protein